MTIEELVDGSERREQPRYAVNIQIDVRIGGEVINALMVDISVEGMRISISKLIKPSTDVTVSFTTAQDVRILSRSVWTLEKNSAGLPSYLVGFKIDSILVNSCELPGLAERTAFLQNLLG